MRRMDAITRNACALRLRASQSLPRRRQRPHRQGKCSFYDPAPRQDDETFRLIGALDDFYLHRFQCGSQGGAELGSLTAAVGIELRQEAAAAEQCGQQPSPTVAVL